MLLIPKGNPISDLVFNNFLITDECISKSRSFCFWTFNILDVLLRTNKITPSYMKVKVSDLIKMEIFCC